VLINVSVRQMLSVAISKQLCTSHLQDVATVELAIKQFSSLSTENY